MDSKQWQMQQLARQLRNQSLRDDFGCFIRKCFATLNPNTAFLPNWHIDLLGEYLEACRTREIRRLIVNMPPRALKSLCVNVAWPAYLLGKNPGERIMSASYAANLSVKHAVDCRRIVQSDWYREVFSQTQLAADQNEKHKFATTRFGHRIATSVGGSATGEGGDFLIMDDPQNPAQVMSDVQRAQAIEWFDHTFISRLDDKQNGVIVLVMQRLHEGDLTGHLLEKGGWEHVSLPAIAERKLLYDFGRVKKCRKQGDVLHPKRENKTQLQQTHKDLGSYAFAAQYQQNPLPMDAGMVRRHWFMRYSQAPKEFTKIVQSWDTAVKATKANDCSVCITIGQAQQQHYILDVQVLRAEYPQLKRMVKQFALDWNADAVLIEDKASGQSLLQDLRRDKAMAPMVALMPKHDKVTRFAAVSAIIEAGQVVLPHDAAWLAEFEREVITFPHGKHDDQVDAFSQYLSWVREWRKTDCRIRGL